MKGSHDLVGEKVVWYKQCKQKLYGNIISEKIPVAIITVEKHMFKCKNICLKDKQISRFMS